MRVSLTARYVSHPSIEFGSRRARGALPRLGLARSLTVFHRPRRARPQPSVAALRPLTSGFRFPTVGRLARVRDRRTVLSLGSSRARRA